ncbi:hypothetical protein M440DRAFT_1441525 [Trichoderma longibrachiatum ATCC 18648]|uniref:Uncharacterized protein n=1 Tax=Trichoderma longibrachiatum ATCC 18648 TaxID=983965 RepID=A0A2T4BTH3_TRILO|nr:hypothetical protein M440DRAFT_1441525 [Trichoderma longibrachiatum ATCC 18648]
MLPSVHGVLYESSCGKKLCYKMCGGDMNGGGQPFEYAPRLDDLPPGTMNHFKRFLARLAPPSPLELSGSGVAFDNPDFFDVRLTHFVAIPQDVVSNELQKDHKLRRCNGQCSCRVVFKASSIIVATEALLYQAQVDRWFYDDFIRKRRAVPLTPADFVVTQRMNRYRTREHPNGFWTAGSLGFILILTEPEAGAWELVTFYGDFEWLLW